jgi:hypothetical protein
MAPVPPCATVTVEVGSITPVADIKPGGGGCDEQPVASLVLQITANAICKTEPRRSMVGFGVG